MQNCTLKKIEDVLNEKVRPLLSEHYGNVEIISFEQGILKIRLLGKCSNCPSANLTTEQLIERELTGAIPQIKRVVLIAGVSDDLLDLARSMLAHK